MSIPLYGLAERRGQTESGRTGEMVPRVTVGLAQVDALQQERQFGRLEFDRCRFCQATLFLTPPATVFLTPPRSLINPAAWRRSGRRASCAFGGN
jgi:hypothetical protein